MLRVMAMALYLHSLLQQLLLLSSLATALQEQKEVLSRHKVALQSNANRVIHSRGNVKKLISDRARQLGAERAPD